MMDESTASANDSFYSKETLITISDVENESMETIPRLLISVATLLQEIIEDNQCHYNHMPIKHDIFFSSRLPSISIEDYLKRIMQYSYIEPATLIAAIIYIDRLREKKNYILSYNNIYRLLIAAILISNKYNDDLVLKISDYAKIGGVSVIEMTHLEYQLYTYLDFQLWITAEHYKCFQKVIRHRSNLDDSFKNYM